MTNSFTPKANNILSVIFTVLLFLLTIVTGFQMTVILEQNRKIELQNKRLSDLPEKYVMLERYGCDIGDLKETLKALRLSMSNELRDINQKLDRALYPFKGLDK